MKNKNFQNYFIGVDIGTDSIGYAATTTDYKLLSYGGEPVWGTHLFDAARLCNERRILRTNRRRLNRKQQRVHFIQEIFAPEIMKVDPSFYKRIYESRLLAEDRQYGENEFMKIYFGNKANQYPTIHHLICDLIESDEPKDVRLVYLACAWIVAHRGHFLSEVSKENIGELLDVKIAYDNFMTFFDEELPWGKIDVEKFAEILGMQSGVNSKYKALCEFLYARTKADKSITEEFPYSKEGILKLLCGGSYKAEDLFGKEEYSQIESIKLNMEDEKFATAFSTLDEDSKLIIYLKGIYDCILLKDIMKGEKYISVSKRAVYEQHKKDLKGLKAFIKKYAPKRYDEIFRNQSVPHNYVAYSGNNKSCKEDGKNKKVKKDEFCKFLNSIVSKIIPKEEDRAFYEDMKSRLATDINTFLPKQVESDNRLIPYQVYWIELKRILDKASNYLPFLKESDVDGYSAIDKIYSVFEFRVPYFVGPLNKASKFAWLERRAGRITPWNFNDMVDLNKSEENFIERMTNTCTYLPNESVLPKCSLMNQRFMVLNEINNLRVNGAKITVELKQEIYTKLFMCRKKVTQKAIKAFLVSNNYYTKDEADTLSGVDTEIKSSLSSYLSFKNYIDCEKLSVSEVERIIKLSAYIENRSRRVSAIKKECPQLTDTQVKEISSFNLKEFGRLSSAFLSEIEGADKNTGEVHTFLDWMWQTNNNHMMLLSNDFTFMEQINQFSMEYYDANPQKLTDRLDEMYISNAVKRPIIRTLDIISDIVKVNDGKAPDKIFIEMARGTNENLKGKRTKTRNQQLRELYGKIKDEDVRQFSEQLDAMGDMVDNRLQSDVLFLYFLQLGRCMYTGEAIDIDKLKDGTFNIDHIYPRSKVKDDSILNNKVLSKSTVNAGKEDKIVSAEIRQKMTGWWKHLLNAGLMTDEKYKRLTRNTPFDDNEKWGFINRQLVETTQSTKAVATILKEKYPDTEIVYVKAGLVSEFRQEFKMLKSRAVNDLHHAKDAYLNIVVGNVYNERFTRQWFLENSDTYNLKIKALFGKLVKVKDKIVWKGGESIDAVRKVISKNNAHFTKYAFCRKGGFYDQTPVKAGPGLAPLKEGLPTEKYGGYNKSTASFYMLAGFIMKKKKELMLVPVELQYGVRFLSDDTYAENYIKTTIEKILGNRIDNLNFPIGKRMIKINTMFELDGFRICLGGKDSGGKCVLLYPMMPLVVSAEEEQYIKRLESFTDKLAKNQNLLYSAEYDLITKEQNESLYEALSKKLKGNCFKKRPAISTIDLDREKEKFASLEIKAQSVCLLQLVSLFGRSANVGKDINMGSGSCKLNAKLSNWNYSDVRIVDIAASGLFAKRTVNLKTLL